MELNGLTLNTQISSQVKPITETDPLEKAFQVITKDSLVVAYLVHKVLIGRYQPPNLVFMNQEELQPHFILKMRIFNKDEELLLWRQQNSLKGRHRIDSQGVDTIAIDAHQVLFGTDAKTSGQWTTISEDRGTEIHLPFSNLRVDTKKERIFIRTRNYIDFNELGQATYVDCRFMGFEERTKNLE